MARPAEFAIGAALLAHASLAWVGSRLPRPVYPFEASRPIELVEVEVGPVERTPEPETKVDEPSSGVAARAPVNPAHANVATRSNDVPQGPSVDPAVASEGASDERPTTPNTPPGPPIDDYDTPPPLAGPSGPLGLGWVVPGMIDDGPSTAAPTQTPVSAPVTGAAVKKALNGTLATRDKKVGVTVPGAALVASAVNDAARAVPVAHNTRATFEVKLGRDGRVAYAKVVSSSGGDSANWDAAAKAVAAQLAKQKLDMGGERGEGAIVRVAITQKHVFPTGSQRGANIKPVCANGFINEIVDATQPKAGKISEPTVPMFQDEFGRPCIPVGIGGVADVSNIGAQKQVQIQSTFSVTVPGELALPTDVHPVNTDAPWIERGKEGPRPTLPQKARKRLQDKEKRK